MSSSMDTSNSKLQKRRASDAPDDPTHDGGDNKNNKKRFILLLEAVNTTESNINDDPSPLDILAEAASTTAPLPKATRRRKRIVLQPSHSPAPTPPGPKKFNLMTALVSHTDIVLQVVGYLTPETILNLYSISAPFHYIMDSHFSAFIMAATRKCAPNADRFFPWWCYRNLCIQDPALRRARTDRRSVSWDEFQPRSSSSSLNSSFSSDTSTADSTISTESVEEVQERVEAASKERQSETAPVPSFRWLKMVAYREIVCKEIIGWLAVHGHRIPRQGGLEALKRMWFLMDIPVNGPRISLMHNACYFPKETLSVLQMLFIKLDMLFTDPLHGYGGEECIREMLMAERTLTTLWNFLRGVDGNNKLDVLKLHVKHAYIRPAMARPMTRAIQEQYDAKMKMPIMGIPAALVGRWGYECWGLGSAKLLRPDQLVLKEAMRRRMELQRMFLQYMAYGYVDRELDPLPDVVKAEDAVLSLICRKKRRQAREKKVEGRMDVDEKEDQRAGRDLDLLGRRMGALLNPT